MDADGGEAQSAAVMLSYLGFFNPSQLMPDYRSLEGLLGMLVEQKHESFRSAIRKPCIHCLNKTDCPVGQVVLKD